MNGWKPPAMLVLVCAVMAALSYGLLSVIESFVGPGASTQLITSVSDYHDADMASISEQLLHRLRLQPFNLVATLLFLCAIAHTLLANRIHQYSKVLRAELDQVDTSEQHHSLFFVETVSFLGEVEVVFGLWVVPLFWLITIEYGSQTAVEYLSGLDYTEPLFVIVVMTLASAYPVVKFAEGCLRSIANLGKGGPKMWWFTLLTIGPLLGSLITEPAAMTLTAMLLVRTFYAYKPTPRLAYATLGALFTNVSVGGVLTNFASPPVLMVAKKWDWTTYYMLGHFGMKAIIGIVITNVVYYLFLHSEFKKLNLNHASKNTEVRGHEEIAIPVWVILLQLFLLGWAVCYNHYPAVFAGAFLIYLAFHQATLPFQEALSLRAPLLVGFFLAGLVVHVTLQGWWIEPLLPRLTEFPLMTLSTVLTAFIDNAAITSLSTTIPNFCEALKYAIVSGAVIGGGLTVIANAPNPAGQSILQHSFPEGISPLPLFLAALPSTLIMFATFYLLRSRILC